MRTHPPSFSGSARHYRLFFGVLLTLLQCIEFSSSIATADDSPTVAARVAGVPITTDQIERQIRQTVGERKIDPATMARLREQTLQHLIDQQLVLQHLTATGKAASKAEIDREIQRLKKSSQQQEVEWSEYLDRAKISEAQLRDQLAWRIGWVRFLEGQATEQNLQRYFEQHRRDFDGTEIRVAHILLPVASSNDPQAVSRAIAHADQIRAQIVGKQRSFAEAAAKFSSAPTADSGGEIGWIGRHQPMPASFSEAAFALDVGQVSEPVVSPFGIHLIQCLEIKPGEKTWREVRGDLYKAVSKFLFDWVADRQRTVSTIEITSGD